MQVTEEKSQEMRKREELRTYPEVTANKHERVRVKEECKMYSYIRELMGNYSRLA
jgi:hypothetical protein